jgi:putative endonuclease
MGVAMRGQFYVYIMANKRNGTIYIGVTSDLARRTYEHREGLVKGFTRRYGLKMLVYYEVFDSILIALQRETSLKRCPRKWKLALIEKRNPQWLDLYGEVGW